MTVPKTSVPKTSAAEARLPPDAVARFRRDGVVFPVEVLDAGEAQACLARLEAIEARRAGRLPPSTNYKPHLLLPWLWDLVHDPRIVGPVADLLGPDLLCYGSSFIAKRPGDGRYVAWHQDSTYWGLSSPEAVTAWVALSPSTPANGCVRMVPGTHTRVYAHTDSGDPANLLGRGEKMVDDVDEATAVDVVLAPGQMSLHHAMIVHGSAAATGGGRRVGFAIRYMPGATRPRQGTVNSATHVRGRDHGHFAAEHAPEGEFHPAAMRRHAEAIRMGKDVVFAGVPPRARWARDEPGGAAGQAPADGAAKGGGAP